MKQVVNTDIAIIGGGIAGLWLLNRLRQLNYGAVLLESDTLGGGQSHKAQGIIHGGMKYALQGVLTPATQAIADMPEVWNACLSGKGLIDLQQVPVLSTKQYLWAPGSLTAKLAGFFAGLALKGNVEALDKKDYPSVFQHAAFKGQVYSLDEIVLDVNVLLRTLAMPYQEIIYKVDAFHDTHTQFDDKNHLTYFQANATPLPAVEIKAQKYIFVAGEGNEVILKQLKHPVLNMQRRPLQMVMMKANFTYPLYAHCMGLGATPRMTITSHIAHDGKMVWYMGGQISEEGVNRSPHEQIQIAKNELQELFPWLDFSAAEFATFFVNRAEPLQPDGKRPDSFFIKNIENTMIAWPTKLAFAPKLAEEIIQLLAEENITPKANDLYALRAFPMPTFAKPIWDQLL
ncbi:hypothetical protein AYO45_02760 [Gammaproteobacteria bacterium SCGC AG-212-F23]|nr:hypothetical protein AYO45_02760 [Gammaproteobacteria bacterium SCGC AG-212-F23]